MDDNISKVCKKLGSRIAVPQRLVSYLPESCNNIQIMTEHEGNRKIYLARGIQEGLETVDYCYVS